MKFGIMAIAMAGILAVGASTSDASNFHRRGYAHPRHIPAYPTCRVPTYHTPHRHPVQVQRHYLGYPKGAYSRLGYPPVNHFYRPYSTYSQFGVHGRNFSLHLGF